MTGTADGEGWHFVLAGWNPWLVGVVILGVLWIGRRIYERELAGQPPLVRLGLAGLRGSALALVVALLLEPALTRTTTVTEPATIRVLVDRSASMAVADPQVAITPALDEAAALGLIDPDERDTSARDAGRLVAELGEDLPRLRAALAAISDSEAATANRTAAAALAERRRAQLREALDGLAFESREDLAVLARAEGLHDALVETLDALASERPGDAVRSRTPSALEDSTEGLSDAFAAVQRRADLALLAEEGAESLRQGLERWRASSRIERAMLLWQRRLRPALEGATVELAEMDPELTPLGSIEGVAATGTRTDIAGTLAAIAESPADAHLRGVVLLTDGRVTEGGSGAPVARALRARGVRLAAVVVGHGSVPRDAVVAEVVGAREVYLGETMVLDVRFRITGYGRSPWRLELRHGDEVLAGRRVRGAAGWQVERFEIPAEEAGVLNLEARLEPIRPAGDEGAERRGLTWQRWDGNAWRGDDRFDAIIERGDDPDHQRPVAGAAAPSNVGNRFAARLCGWLVPPTEGEYRLEVASDGPSRLFLADGEDPADAEQVLALDRRVEPGGWGQRDDQVTGPIAMERGGARYVELRYRDGRGGDHAAIGWRLPDGSHQRPIPSDHLVPWSPDDGPYAPARIGSEATTANNRVELAVVVHEDPLRILLVDAMARWDSRYLAAMFERDRRVEVVRSYQQVEQARGVVRLLPEDQERLDRFDVVVFGDLRPDELAKADQQRLVEFVTRRGGFLILLAGPRALPSQYSLGGLAEILPVRSGRSAAGGDEPRRVALTEEGGRHAITGILDDRDLNRRMWPLLPAIDWVAGSVRAKPAARVLLATADADALPVLAIMRVGAGRVLYMGTDRSWRWRDRLGDRVHQTLWLQALRWGLGARLRGSDPRLQVALDRSLAEPGEVVELRARRVDASGAAVDVAPELVLEGETTRRLAMVPVPDGTGLWRAQLDGLLAGTWVVTVSAGDGLRESRTLIVREDRARETVELSADPAALARVTRAAEGETVGVAEAGAAIERLASELPPRRRRQVETTRLWDNYAALTVIVGLLLVEWLWRKRRGLP